METANVNCTGTVPGNAQATVTGGLPAYAYSWDSGETTADIHDLDTGMYTLTVTDRNMCQITDTALIGQNSIVQIDIQVIGNISCNQDSDGILFAAVSKVFRHTHTSGITAMRTIPFPEWGKEVIR